MIGFRWLVIIISGITLSSAFGQIESNVRQTKHNLSITGLGTVKAQSETEICVFCHTPHGATQAPGAPLWNRQLSGQTYTTYLSSSIDAELVNGQLAQPAGSSKLCLSCHDGTLAIGTVNVLAGQQNVDILMSGVAGDGTMPPGNGITTGFTRDLGIDLTNDHPVSVTYDDALANADGELRVPDALQQIPPGVGDLVAIRDHSNDVKPLLPLETTGPNNRGQVQCATCHDPHVRDTGGADIKFLRANRFQQAAAGGGDFNEANDIICIACHDKDLNAAGWANSAHAHPSVANEVYSSSAATVREFPAGIQVWEASCLNCHDTHTVQGARRLAREGTDDNNSPKQGGNSAIEETCYQCHSNPGRTILTSTAEVPNVETDFSSLRHMPIDNIDQQTGIEVHDIGTGTGGFEGLRRGIDLIEEQQLLGKTVPTNRHVECTDCHHPHRMIKNRLFNDNAASPDVAGTHLPGTNLASGVLRGSWGVEPVYTSSSFQDLPASYDIKRGIGISTAASVGHVTREYQICLKCHSDYGYDDDNVYPTGSRPNLGDSGGGTPAGTNGLDQYTNQAKEFQAPSSHMGEGTATNSGAGSAFTTDNHRSWHPVIDATGRSLAARSISAGNNPWIGPWTGGVGSQTMYCSDCHGSDTGPTTIEPNGGEDGNPWGPHGSINDFILKGTWDGLTGGDTREVPSTDPKNGLCFKCHDYQSYADRDGDSNDSGFSGSKSNNLHAFHADKIEKLHCSWCHTAVPHGWKNKALLVNLNDVGEEAGQAPGTEVTITSDGEVYDQGPYYQNAKLKIINFAQSGNWEDTNCGSASGDPENDVGREWMRNVCANPP